MSLDFERARFNMIEQQVRTWQVLDGRVLDALRRVRREEFVPARYRQLAFTDVSLPLEQGETMMKPVVEGRVLQALAFDAGESALEIGTGSGYLTACLAELGREVHSVEIHSAMAERARARIAAAGYTNVRIDCADAIASFDPARRFNVVCVTGAVFSVPQHWRDWLEVGGRMFVIHGESPVMQASLVTRRSESEFGTEHLFETDLPYLVNAAPPRKFTL